MSIGFGGFIVCTLAWGTIGVLVDDVEVSAPVIAFFRLALGFAVVLAWSMSSAGRRRDLPARSGRGLMVLAGLVLAAHWLLQFEAFKRLDVAAAILLVFLGPVLSTALAPIVLRERLERSSIVALGVALGGIASITVPDLGATDARGVAAALGSAVLFAVLILVAKVLSGRHPAPTIVVWQQGAAATALAPALLTTDGPAVAADLAELLVLGVVLTGILSIVFFHSLRRLKAQQASVLFYLEPASATVYAWLLLDQRPAASTLAGGALIVLAGLVIIRAQRAVAPGGLPDVVVAAEEMT